jgi:hypothetical protein
MFQTSEGGMRAALDAYTSVQEKVQNANLDHFVLECSLVVS